MLRPRQSQRPVQARESERRPAIRRVLSPPLPCSLLVLTSWQGNTNSQQCFPGANCLFSLSESSLGSAVSSRAWQGKSISSN